jgi:LPS sulfotransferase NodH
MGERFDYFVIFAEMRTGSNFLEANLNAFDGLTCHGEAFNPHFIGYPNRTEILGVTQDMRDKDPQTLIAAIRNTPGALGGFRYFHDHDPRVLDTCLDDPRCAKIILTRNPLESYVSWKIAKSTGQWKLTNVKRRKDGEAEFDGPEFERFVAKLQEFQVMLLNRLQTSGQTAFYVAYEDLQDLDVMNGLARFLGCAAQLDQLDDNLKRQNPQPLRDKVSNPEEMERALARFDAFNLSRTPNFEPRRGPVVPSYVACARAPLLYLPVRGGIEDAVCQWMAALDEGTVEDLQSQMNQKDLRQWKRGNKGHRSFTVLRHPVARAHHVFCRRILQRGPGCFSDIRKTLRNFHKLPIPGDLPDESYTLERHREAFLAFLQFLQANLNGQTNVRVDAHWASQLTTLQGFAQLAPPDLVLREDELSTRLPELASRLCDATPPAVPRPEAEVPFPLEEVYTSEIEKAAAQVYQRDYVAFGFRKWG